MLIRCLALTSIVLASTGRGDEPKPIVADKVRVRIVDAKETMDIKPNAKVKLKVEVRQPPEAPAPDFVFVYLGIVDSKSLYCSYVAPRVGKSTDPLTYELEFTMIGKVDKPLLYAEAACVEAPPAGSDKSRITRVLSEKTKILTD